MSEPQNVVLPPKYYLDYFNYLLDFVKDKYRHILQENEWRFLRKFYGLSEDAQCLFIRLANRRSLFFRTGKLKYEELCDIGALLSELTEKGFIESLNEAHEVFIQELLSTSTKAELLKITREKTSNSIQKADLIEYIRESEKPAYIIQQISVQQNWIKVNFEFETTFLKFLFFGNRYMDMTEFVIRDLGFVQYFQHDDDKLVARFDTRKDAEDKWMLSDQTELFEQLKKTDKPEAIYDWFMTLLNSLNQLSEVAKPSLERLKYKIGRHFERSKKYEQAVEVYSICSLPSASERHIRSLFKLGKNTEALALCEELVAHSQNADEVFFAKDFAERIIQNSPRKKKLTTQKLQQSEQISIDPIYRGQVELGTIAHFLAAGKMAVFSENHLWRGIFGLTFWDIIFDPSLVAFHHPFQRRPSDLHLPDFYQKREEAIHSHLAGFENTDALLVFMRKKFVENEGIANPFVIWLDELWETIRVATQCIGLEKLKGILIHIAKDITENSRGFPDLFVWDDEDYAFIEVKSPTDNLSNRQLFWLGYFEENGINARVLRISFNEG